jgi:predicted aspartyl protease
VNVKKTLGASLITTLLWNPLESVAKRIPNTPENESSHAMLGGRVPVSVRNGFLVVAAGQIGGIAAMQNFVVDTGTAPSILNARLAKKLGLEVNGATLVAVGRAVKSGRAVVPELDLGPIQVTNLPVNVMDLSQLENSLGTEIAALIGMDVLGRASFRLDYDKKELDFGDVAVEGIAVEYDGASRLALAEASLQGRRVRLIVDTGSDLVVVYGKSWEAFEAPRLVSEVREGTSVAEQVLAREVTKPEMQLGGRQFRGMRTYYVPSGAAVGYDGFFGVRALKLHGISFDRTKQRMYLLN